jgi:hypothetical protein
VTLFWDVLPRSIPANNPKPDTSYDCYTDGYLPVTWSNISDSGFIGDLLPIPAMKSNADTGAGVWLLSAGGYIV